MKKLFFLLALVTSVGMHAQLHKNLDSLEVFAKRSVADIQVLEIDSTVLQFLGTENLGDVLQKHSGINVNANGFFGQVSSPSSGGLGSDHVKIYWEGVELNQLTLGSFDLSLFPTFLAGKVRINSGSDFNTLSGTASGLGVNIQTAHGGNNQLNFGVGSFGYYRTSVKVSDQKGRVNFSVQPYIISSQNNFEYEEKQPRDVVLKESEHNALQQYGVMADVRVGTQWKTGIWAQKRSKQLPSILQQSGASSALQLDENYRVFTRFNPNSKWEWQADYSNDNLVYRDKLDKGADYDIHSTMKLQRLGNHLRYRFYVKQFKIQAQSQVLYYNVLSSGFSNTKDQWRIQNQLTLEYKKGPIYARVASKLVGIESQKWQNTLMASAGYSYKKVTLSYGVNQRFKAPDFNDLYWANGGNPDLKNEEGWSHYFLLHTEGKWTAELKATHTELKNKIQWIPTGNNWSPINIHQLRNFALDAKVGRNWKKENHHVGFTAFANRTIANEMDVVTGDYRPEQVIYLPLYKAGVTANLERKNWQLSTSAYVMSERFTEPNNDELFALKPYYNMDLGISRMMEINTTSCRLQLQINNVLNNTELLTLSRPNPGRYYRINIVIEI
jgi:iron complex outermembrane receptor protein